jgi:hypothetical protein
VIFGRRGGGRGGGMGGVGRLEMGEEGRGVRRKGGGKRRGKRQGKVYEQERARKDGL